MGSGQMNKKDNYHGGTGLHVKLIPKGKGEGEFDNAICTCFLENLINRASRCNELYNRFIPYLGPNSKEFCKDWDRFTGVPSPGLWAEEEWLQANSSD